MFLVLSKFWENYLGTILYFNFKIIIMQIINLITNFFRRSSNKLAKYCDNTNFYLHIIISKK